jgi:hypothetical protein
MTEGEQKFKEELKMLIASAFRKNASFESVKFVLNNVWMELETSEFYHRAKEEASRAP